ncbi:MAG: ABC transporter substrate-binding protein [Dehalococcoidales bacterium]|nr:ABC transporter substrate-binding protein [Dehalococcoidales bacterium]
MFKKVITMILTLCMVAVIIAGCKTNVENEPSGAIQLKYATGFKIKEVGGQCQIVTDAENQSFILLPKGKKAPVLVTPGDKASESYANLPQINTPVERVVILSVTFGALMRPLGVIDTVVGSGTLEDELYIDEMKQGYASGNIKYVGGGGMGAPDFEAIQALDPDVVFLSTGYPDAVKYYEQLKGMGITVVVCNDFLESHPLARLEWMKFIAAFYDKEQPADTYFDGVEKKIDDIKMQAMLSSRLASVLWASIFMGNCYVSGGDSYVAKMIELAGGNYVFKYLAGNGASSIALEELYARGQNCNEFIYASTPPYINSIKEIVDGSPVLADLPVIEAGEVYCFQPWFYQISDKPDEIVQDLAYIFHPSRFPDYQLKHFMLLPVK